MVTMVQHGGRCCGARHLQGFGPTENTNPNLINNAARGVDRFRMTEVILNGNQVRDNANVLQRLADLGFVLVGHYINGNHMSHNYVFHRCDRRLPLTAGINWPGQVLTPLLQGDLPEIAAVNVNPPPRLPPMPDERLYDPIIRVGSRVRVNSPTSRRNGQEFIVRSRTWDDRMVMTDRDGDEFTIVRANLEKIIPPRPAAPPAPPAPAPAPPVPPQRHEQPDAGLIGAPAEPVLPTVMISFYHNVYAAGRSDIAWGSIEAARGARGNARRIDRHDLLTNGDFVWVEGVTR